MIRSRDYKEVVRPKDLVDRKGIRSLTQKRLLACFMHVMDRAICAALWKTRAPHVWGQLNRPFDTRPIEPWTENGGDVHFPPIRDTIPLERSAVRLSRRPKIEPER